MSNKPPYPTYGEWPKNSHITDRPAKPRHDCPDCGCISSSPTHVCKSPRIRRPK